MRVLTAALRRAGLGGGKPSAGLKKQAPEEWGRDRGVIYWNGGVEAEEAREGRLCARSPVCSESSLLDTGQETMKNQKRFFYKWKEGRKVVRERWRVMTLQTSSKERGFQHAESLGWITKTVYFNISEHGAYISLLIWKRKKNDCWSWCINTVSSKDIRVNLQMLFSCFYERRYLDAYYWLGNFKSVFFLISNTKSYS